MAIPQYLFYKQLSGSPIVLVEALRIDVGRDELAYSSPNVVPMLSDMPTFMLVMLSLRYSLAEPTEVAIASMRLAPAVYARDMSVSFR